MKKVFDHAICFFRRFFKKKSSKKKSNHWSTKMSANIDTVANEIEKDIFDIADSKRNLDKLKSTFIGSNFVSFIGGGTSQLTGIPPWENLVGKLCALANIKFDKESDDLPKKASEAKLSLKNEGKLDSYYKCLQSEMEGVQTKGTEFHRMVVDRFDKYITTNFDLKVYNYYNSREKSSEHQSIPNLDFKKFQNGDQPFVFLHGCIGAEFKCIIFEEEIYNHYYPNVSNEWGSPEIERFLEKVCRSFSLVFFGSSFSDKYLSQTFRNIFKTLKVDKRSDIKLNEHFLIIDQTALKINNLDLLDQMQNTDGTNRIMVDRIKAQVCNWFDEFQNMNIYPIIYRKNAHRFTENVLSSISNMRKG